MYLHARGSKHELFAESQNALNRNFGAINTLVLLTSSLLVVFAGRALRSEKWRHLAQRLTLAGVSVGACFVVIKVNEYHEKISAGITPSTNEFFMYYFVLTGLHLAHVIVGLLVLVALSRLRARPSRPRRTSPSSKAVAAFGTWSTCCGSSSSRCCSW